MSYEEILALEHYMMFGHYEDGQAVSKGAVNTEDRVYRLNPLLSCSYCKPNRHENNSWSYLKRNKRTKTSKKRTVNRTKARNLKTRQFIPDESFFLIVFLKNLLTNIMVWAILIS